MSHGCDNLTGAIRENIKINRDEIKVFYMDKVNDIIYRRILKPGEYSKKFFNILMYSITTSFQYL